MLEVEEAAGVDAEGERNDMARGIPHVPGLLKLWWTSLSSENAVYTATAD